MDLIHNNEVHKVGDVQNGIGVFGIYLDAPNIVSEVENIYYALNSFVYRSEDDISYLKDVLSEGNLIAYYPSKGVQKNDLQQTYISINNYLDYNVKGDRIRYLRMVDINPINPIYFGSSNLVVLEEMVFMEEVIIQRKIGTIYMAIICYIGIPHVVYVVFDSFVSIIIAYQTNYFIHSFKDMVFYLACN